MKRIEVEEINDTVRLVLDGTPIAEMLGTKLQKLKRACSLAARWNQRSRDIEDALEEAADEANAEGEAAARRYHAENPNADGSD